MENLKFYYVDDDYIDALHNIDERVAKTKAGERSQTRKYIGILFNINGLEYFANLSSYKPHKHDNKKETIDFLKVGTFAVINLNNMIPIASGKYHYVKFDEIDDDKYKNLLRNEYKIISQKTPQIIKNAHIVYQHKLRNGDITSLGKRTCDFIKLEEYAKSLSS